MTNRDAIRAGITVCEWFPADDPAYDRPARLNDPFHAPAEVRAGTRWPVRCCLACSSRPPLQGRGRYPLDTPAETPVPSPS